MWPMIHISYIKRIRTYTIPDLSQKAFNQWVIGQHKQNDTISMGKKILYIYIYIFILFDLYPTCHNTTVKSIFIFKKEIMSNVTVTNYFTIFL